MSGGAGSESAPGAGVARTARARVRPIAPADVAAVWELLRGLAEYEKLTQEVTASEAGLRETLFGARPAAEVLIGFANNEPAALAVFFHNFSTFLGKPGLYLEDLFVQPEWRGRGFGRAMLTHLARLAVERGCGRMEWAVLDWNQPAIDFYLKIGAVPR